MRLLLAFFAFYILVSCNHFENHTKELVKSNDPFAKIEFDSVIAYDFPGNTGISLIDSNGQITKIVTKQIKLDSINLDLFKNILTDSSTFGDGPVIDFYPHFGIVFFKENKIVDHLEVSLICRNIYASFKIPEQEKKMPNNFALTESGVNKIWQYCKNLGFDQYLDKSKWPK